jgi:branched-chain amino acid transport system ATP-binding protein
VPLLEAWDIVKRFGGVRANDGASIYVDQGEIVGLLGPNGAGKTTLFNCIAGMYRPDAGRIVFGGDDITGWRANRVCLRGIARTFQIVRSLKEMTALENAMVGAFARTSRPKEARRRAHEALEIVGLANQANMCALHLTLVEKKRLELARALATQPRLLMLDEVMAGLTPAEQQESVSLLRRLRESGLTILMVEHVMEVVMPISDRIVVLDAGKTIAQGMPRAVVRDERVIAAYLGERYRHAPVEPSGGAHAER